MLFPALALVLALALTPPAFLSRDYVRQVAAERATAYGLDVSRFVAVVGCESNFRYNAVGDHGHSFGPAQLNDRGLLPQYQATTGRDPNNVYLSLTFMARQFALGNAHAWSCAR